MDELDSHDFGTLLKSFRVLDGQSQQDFADQMGVTRVTVSNWETGKNLPKPQKIDKIGQALHLKPDDVQKLMRALLATIPAKNPDFSQSLPSTTTQEEDMQGQNDKGMVDELESGTRFIAFVLRMWHTILKLLQPEPLDVVVTPQQRKQNRQRMLAQVHADWITGYLEQSSYQSAPISLELRELLDAVVNPWREEHREIDAQREYTTFHSTDIKHLYDDASGKLLILGMAGSGKTTLLLQLTRHLLARAKNDKEHQIPVVFNLSTWAAAELPLSEWLVQELNVKYHVSREIGDDWVSNTTILPLLDGLDEVIADRQEACIDAINVYLHSHSLVRMVVCLRSESYVRQTKRLALRRAVVIQPLKEGQIKQYILDAGMQMERILSIIQYDQELQTLVSTPLMLSILKQVYPDAVLKSIQQRKSLDAQLKQVFESYIERMLQRRTNSTSYSKEESMSWLTWLAKQLKQHNESEFFLERMQMNWLPAHWRYLLYPSIAVGLVYGLFFALIKGVNYAILQGADQQGRSFGLSRGILDGLLIGAGNTLLFVLLNGVVFGVLAQRKKNWSGKNWKHLLFNFLQTRSGYGFVNGLWNGLLICLLVDAPAGIYNGLFAGVVYAGLGKLPTEIVPSEAFSWSWKRMRNGVSKFVGGGVLIGVFYGLFTAGYWQIKSFPALLGADRLLPCLLFGLCVGAVIGLFIALMRGLAHDELEKQPTSRPNQGMWNALRNSTVVGLIVWLFFGLFFGLVYSVILRWTFQLFNVTYKEYGGFFPRDSGLMLGLTYGLVFASFFWLVNGGIACIQHLLLRYLLWRKGNIPWNYPHFLESASEQLLLRRVGGGYVFIHQKILESFAMRSTSSSTINKAQQDVEAGSSPGAM